MKNGKNPTLRQRNLMERAGFNSDDYLVSKDYSDALIVVHRLTDKTEHIEKGGG